MSLRDPCVVRYSPELAGRWDSFVSTARNATFLFLRSYMDYHEDRFKDHSLVVTRGGEIRAVLPANDPGSGALVSHQGLTYGGLVIRKETTLQEVSENFRACLSYLHGVGIQRLTLKRLPRHYASLPDDEIDYALFLLGARLTRRECALVVPRDGRLPFRKSRRQEIALAVRHGVRYAEATRFDRFWLDLLIPRLHERFRKSPVHTLEEISRLADLHPGAIRQFCAYLGDKLLAGTTIYETPNVARAQYIAVSREGQELGALDGLTGWLISERYAQKPYFDFGTSSLEDGRGINQGLHFWKEGFGARTSSHDTYEIETSSHPRLDPGMTEATR